MSWIFLLSLSLFWTPEQLRVERRKSLSLAENKGSLAAHAKGLRTVRVDCVSPLLMGMYARSPA